MTHRYSPYFADLSSNNAAPDFPHYRGEGHILVAIKATEGNSYINPFHRGWSLQAGGYHINVIHYHFARPDLGTSPVEEAQHFIGVVKPLLGPHDHVVLDLERATPQGWSHDPAWSLDFSAEVRRMTRYVTILYGSRSTLSTSDRWLDGEPKRVWDADWSTSPDFPPPGYDVAFRQLNDGVVGPGPHSLPGIGRCDVNICRGRTWQQTLRHYGR